MLHIYIYIYIYTYVCSVMKSVTWSSNDPNEISLTVSEADASSAEFSDSIIIADLTRQIYIIKKQVAFFNIFFPDSFKV